MLKHNHDIVCEVTEFVDNCLKLALYTTYVASAVAITIIGICVVNLITY
jgi:hypothetical protein